MFRIPIISCLLLVLTSAVSAQQQQLPPDLAGLPDEIKNLQWKSIDLAAVPVLDQCRALLFMNHTLDELSANTTSEADLMSAYIEKNNLGAQFATTPPPPGPTELSYTDAEKVAVAMLRGPLSQSYYATELSDTPASGLASYQQMIQRTCQRRWSEFAEARHQIRCMSSFLGNSQKLADYDAWATAESILRQKQYEQRAGAKPAGEPAAQPSAAQQQSQAQIQQLQQALGSAEYQQAQAQQQTAQAQQQTAQAQQQADQAQQQSGQAQQAGYVAPVAYGGYGAYGAAAAGAYAGAAVANTANKTNVSPAGAAAAGAAAANNQPKTNAAGAGQYHGANSSWNKDSSYNSAARSQTDQRMSSFHGAPAGRR